MRHALALVALVSTMSAAAPAFAQSNGSARCNDAPASDREHTYCFETTNVGADAVGPNDGRSTLIRQMHGPSLLRIRAHFVNEMLKSVENL